MEVIFFSFSRFTKNGAEMSVLGDFGPSGSGGNASFRAGDPAIQGGSSLSCVGSFGTGP